MAHVTTVAVGTDPDAALGAACERCTSFARGLLLYLAAVALVVSRRPEGITNPQFWAEDGKVWFAQAYNEGALSALLSPWTGYAQTFSRLVAAASLMVPFRHAPLVFNVAAVLAQALAPFFLASSRLASIILFAAVTLLSGIGGPAFVARALIASRSAALRLFALFATLALGAALASPVLSAVPRWERLRLPNVGIRYMAPPILAWLAALLWSACADPAARVKQLARAALACVLLIGLPLDWRVASRPDLEFARHAERFERRQPGKKIRIPIPPEGWKMHLWKH